MATKSTDRSDLSSSLDEFAQYVGIICALEAGDKLSSVDAYNRVKSKWKELKQTRKSMMTSTVSHSDGVLTGTEG